MKKENAFNVSASEIVRLANTLSRLKGRSLWCSPESLAVARESVAGIRERCRVITHQLELASLAREPGKADKHIGGTDDE